VPDFPALLARTKGENILAICDLHLGIEEQYLKAGAYIKPVTEKTAKKIGSIARENDVQRLVIVGDIKHTIPWTTLMESREVPKFFELLAKDIERFELIIGNHDARLKELFTREQRTHWGIKFHNEAFTLGDLAFIHGHRWPPARVFNKRFLLMAHNHPTVELPQGIGMSIYRPCWIRTSPVKRKVFEHFPDVSIPDDQEIIVMPSVLGETRGTSFNSKGVRLLGPILKNGLVDLKNARIYLLDGTELGRVKDIKA